MLIPSIDLLGGKIVQLVQGEKLKLSFDDFDYWIERFSEYPLVQLIDLDAAMRQGDNRASIEMICKRLPCQVGGGLRTAEDGRRLLEAGAKRVIYGSSLFGAEEESVTGGPHPSTLSKDGAPGFGVSGGSVAGAHPSNSSMDGAHGGSHPSTLSKNGAPGLGVSGESVAGAHPSNSSMDGAHKFSGARRHKLIRLEFAEELKRTLGEDALCFSVDTKNGKVAVRGWKEQVDLTPEEAVTWLEDYCGAFLYTHVDTEGTMQGFPMEIAAILRSTTAKQLIVAGGIKERREVDELDAMGVDAVAGMAVYSGAMEA